MKRIKKLLVICIAFVGISLVATAAVNLYAPRADIESSLTSNSGEVILEIGYINADHLDVYDCTETVWYYLFTLDVDNTTTIEHCLAVIQGLVPGLHEFRVLPRNAMGDEGLMSKPFRVYVN